MITLSILVTFYNQEKYVDRALENIFNQEVNFDFEVIVGDDGSTDGTLKKIEKWHNKYPNIISLYIQPRENKKYLSGERASCNRLSLLKHVTGKYFMYLDGDDCYCDKRKIQKQVDILEDIANSDCSCCSHNVNFIHLDGTSSILKTWFKNTGKIKFSHYWWKGYFHPDSLMFRSENIKQNEHYEHPLFFDDNYITYIFAHTGNIYFLDDVMAHYYESTNGIWNGTPVIIGWIRTLTIYEYLWKLYKKNRITAYLRALPLYYLLLKNSDGFRAENVQPYFDVAKENGLKKLSNLREYGKINIALLKVKYKILYIVNACLKRVF